AMNGGMSPPASALPQQGHQGRCPSLYLLFVEPPSLRPAFLRTDLWGSLSCHHSDLDRNVTTGGYVADLASGSVRLWASRTCSNLVTEARLERPPSPTAPVAILGLPYIVLLFG
ncbi:MAG: hypothetical protein WCO94_12435, partial [Verrucomicrobiota bacterium]